MHNINDHFRGEDNMFRIFVCDDEEIFRKHLEQLLEDYLKVRIKSYEIQYFSSAEELLKANYEQCDMFCLDVEIGTNANGIDLARKIRMKNFKADIIFTTSHPEEAHYAFEVNALRYLLKPIQEEQLYKALDLILKKRKERLSKLITLNQGQRFFQLPFGEILYFETVDRKLRAVTVNKEYLIDNKINEVDKSLSDKNFFRIHKSYLINLAYVKEYDQTTVTMQNNDVVYMSRLRIKAFKESFRLYLKEEHKIG